MKYRKRRKFAANCACALSKTSDILTLRNFASHRCQAKLMPSAKSLPNHEFRSTKQNSSFPAKSEPVALVEIV